MDSILMALILCHRKEIFLLLLRDADSFPLSMLAILPEPGLYQTGSRKQVQCKRTFI